MARCRPGISLVVLALAPALCAQVGCGKKKEDEGPVSAPLPMGQASADRLSTGVGLARALSAELAPSAAVWRRVVVIDEKRVALFGETAGATIALSTDDGGKTWRSLRAEPGAWSAWSAGPDGTLVFATGTREAPRGRIDAARLQFAPPDATELGAPSTLFPPEGAPARTRAAGEVAVAAVLSRDSAALVVEDAPRRASVLYAAPPGAAPTPLLRLPPSERVSPIPMGRPPLLVSILGRDVVVRPVPSAGQPLGPAAKIVGVVATPAMPTELARPPACEAGAWSFQAVAQPGGRRLVVGVSADRSVAVELPASAAGAARFGCGAGRIVVETAPTKAGPGSIAVCDLDGHCALPKTPPFRPWPETHEEQVVAESTGQGIVAVTTSRAGERWGVYLTQSTDGLVYELPRVIGEGSGERGRVEIGALISLGRRALLIVSADVTGTSRRGWYAMASDDGGATWNPP